METNKLHGMGLAVVHRNVRGVHILALDKNGHSRCWCHPYEYESTDERSALKMLFMVAGGTDYGNGRHPRPR